MEKRLKKFGELNDGEFVYFVYNGKLRNVSTSIVAQIVHGGCSNVVFDSVKPDSSSETFPARFDNDTEVYVTTSFQDATDKFEKITGSEPDEVIMDIDNGTKVPTSEFRKMVCDDPVERMGEINSPSEIEEFLFGLVGVFNHYEFFTKELWRKAPGFRDKDEAEVKCAFMHKLRNEKFGGYTSTCGCDWFFEVSKESFDSYIKEYSQVFEMYKEWMDEQR